MMVVVDTNVPVRVLMQRDPPILQAVDSKWLDFRDAFRRNGVVVEFICEDDIQRLHGSTGSEK